MIRFVFPLLFITLLLCTPYVLHAQLSQTLSVTPPLFQISVAPGDTWQSRIKVVNSNQFPLTIYAEPVNFTPEGEKGKGRFVPIPNDAQGKGATLAEWITIGTRSQTIPPEQSRDISFVLNVPEDAPPGGHFAAILVGTEPPDEKGAVAVRTSQIVSSLFFLRVAGEIVEKGRIREFSADRSFVETPEASFTLRFENEGNVHLQPRGDIVIANMWGKERGIIPINHQTSFGNVLPGTIRAYTFTWDGEPSLADIGRYTAIATVGFGENGVKSDSAKLSFWVVPIKATLIALCFLVLSIAFIAWVIRLYVRRMLALAGVDVETMEHVGTRRTLADTKDIRITRTRNLAGPLRAGFDDFRRRLSRVQRMRELLATLGSFLIQYRVFFGSLAVLVGIAVGGSFYVGEVSEDQRAYEVTIEEDGEARTVTSEEIIKDRIDTETRMPTSTQPFALTIINASGEPGTAAEIAVHLESRGYRIDALSTDSSRSQAAHAIVYDEPLQTEAEALSELLGGALISARESADDAEPSITIIAGARRF